MSGSASLRTALSHRALKRLSNGKAVRLTVFAPIQNPGDPNGDWVCEFEITGLGERVQSRAFGVDSMQALVEAVRGLRKGLEPFTSDLTWLSGRPGDTGVPYIVPYDDPDFTAVIVGTVQVESARQVLNSGGSGRRTTAARKRR